MATKKTAKKPATKKKATRNLGTATGVAERRQRKPPLEKGMAAQREDDAKEVKVSAAAAHVKQDHSLSKECTTRLATARMETTTHEAISHDIDRVLELVDDIKDTAQQARKALVL